MRTRLVKDKMEGESRPVPHLDGVTVNTLTKWLNKPVVVTLSSSGELRGTLIEVDEQWLTVERPKDKGVVVVAIYGVLNVCLNEK